MEVNKGLSLSAHTTKELVLSIISHAHPPVLVNSSTGRVILHLAPLSVYKRIVTQHALIHKFRQLLALLYLKQIPQHTCAFKIPVHVIADGSFTICA